MKSSNEMVVRSLDPLQQKKEMKAIQLAEVREGWYLCSMLFKRVTQTPSTGKYRYLDTTFQAYVRAASGGECFERIVEHLKGRPEIDTRSQFPSARGNNYSFEFVGEELPAGVLS